MMLWQGRSRRSGNRTERVPHRSLPFEHSNTSLEFAVKRLAFAGLFVATFLFARSASAADRVFDWVQVTDKAGWQPRDSQGELVHDNKLWIMGGWFDSYHA